MVDLLATILRRSGKGAPPDLRKTAVEIYLLGLPTGAATVFGSQFKAETMTGELIRDRVRDLIGRSPPLPARDQAASPETPREDRP